MKRIVAGVMAHVDSGKTTLCEALLYHSGEIRTLGRVDRQNAFLDTHGIERRRGITIFSKQAVIHTPSGILTLLDTPGHADFSAEAERTLRVMDCCILLINAADGVQSHTETLWKLLLEYKVPVFIFINKTDLPGFDRAQIMTELSQKLGEGFVDFGGDFTEDAAMCSESLMEYYLQNGTLSDAEIQKAISERKLFPCCFGSALKLSGTKEFLEAFMRYSPAPVSPESFGARVFKTAADENGLRLTFMRITGGSLKVKTQLYRKGSNDGEKVNQIRIYSGKSYECVNEAFPGDVCAVSGISSVPPGTGFGTEDDFFDAHLRPVLSYRIIFPENTDIHSALLDLRKLEDEEPQFCITSDKQNSEIYVRIMGEIQLEVLKQLLLERFNLDVSFDSGKILYKETIAAPTEGVGHYEPLKHYAEVHLLLEPGKRGSGVHFSSDLSEDILDRNWQRLILTHLAEKTHLGVLTGSPITDIKITLVAGKAHQKHTEGGDFRQATYRAVRHGLKNAQSVLLEPWYSFKITLPQEDVGRAMNDINNMGGTFSSPENCGEYCVLSGSAPVSSMQNYHAELTAYTHGQGKLSCTLKGYEPCHNSEQVIKDIGYDPDADIENSADSVFCSHGAGFLVKWNEVCNYMHLPSYFARSCTEESDSGEQIRGYIESIADDSELMRIFERTYGPIKHETYSNVRIKKPCENTSNRFKAKPLPSGPEYLLVDGYNIIFAWEELKKLASVSLDSARSRLIDLLSDYRGVKQCELIIVFDAYKVKNNPGSIEKIHNIHVVYTKEAETADMYIERVTHELGKKHRVRVATSDNTEQIIILGGGALRVSADSFLKEVNAVKEEIRKFISK